MIIWSFRKGWRDETWTVDALNVTNVQSTYEIYSSMQTQINDFLFCDVPSGKIKVIVSKMSANPTCFLSFSFIILRNYWYVNLDIILPLTFQYFRFFLHRLYMTVSVCLYSPSWPILPWTGMKYRKLVILSRSLESRCYILKGWLVWPSSWWQQPTQHVLKRLYIG